MSEHETYLDTIKRMEPDIHPVDAAAFYASAAISLKRIADSLDGDNEQSLLYKIVCAVDDAVEVMKLRHARYLVDHKQKHGWLHPFEEEWLRDNGHGRFV